MRYLLGIDLGSSSVKVALVEVESGRTVEEASYPPTEAPIKSLQSGWAEQRPDDWWNYTKQALAMLRADLKEVAAIGISYQMHGLVCLDRERSVLRDAIIWCDSRGVPYGEDARRRLGDDLCMNTLRGMPGNFTATKLAWVREHEPALFDRLATIMLPGDWLAMRLTGHAATTDGGLSEMMLWDYSAQKPAQFLMDALGIPLHVLPERVEMIGLQGEVTSAAARELGLEAGTPVTYRAGDQPNNALSLNVFDPGEVAATAGTSGVVYGVAAADIKPTAADATRVNTFMHVNRNLGVMHCVNGCGIMNAWIKRMVAPEMSYDEINRLAETVPVGSDGVSILPFGNGAERVLQNEDMGCLIGGVNFIRHGQSHLLRGAQEGIAFSLVYGMELMRGMGMRLDTLRAGRANLFLSPLFREALATTSQVAIELVDTDGAVGAARAAGLGAGIYASRKEAFASLRTLACTMPDRTLRAAYADAYDRWKSSLNRWRREV